MRLIVIIFLVLIVSCNDIIDRDKALKLSSYLNTLENTDQRQKKIMVMEHDQLRNQMENMSILHLFLIGKWRLLKILVGIPCMTTYPKVGTKP
jgi:hypothetical protein